MARISYSKKLGKSVASGAKSAASKRLHVLSSTTGKWVIVRDGTTHSEKAFVKKDSAIQYARMRASLSSGEIIIHKADGRVQNRISSKKK